MIITDDVSLRSYLSRNLPKGVKFARLHAPAINLDAYGVIIPVVNKTNKETRKAGFIAYGIPPDVSPDDISEHHALFSFVQLDYDGTLDVANRVVDCVVDFAQRR